MTTRENAQEQVPEFTHRCKGCGHIWTTERMESQCPTCGDTEVVLAR